MPSLYKKVHDTTSFTTNHASHRSSSFSFQNKGEKYEPPTISDNIRFGDVDLEPCLDRANSRPNTVGTKQAQHPICAGGRLVLRARGGLWL